jgi:hypothetical protein
VTVTRHVRPPAGPTFMSDRQCSGGTQRRQHRVSVDAALIRPRRSRNGP